MILKIIEYPADVLSTPTEPLSLSEVVSSDFQTLIENMKDTCHDAGGLGLSANQVGISKSLCIYRQPGRSVYDVLVNPIIISKEGKMTSKGEGCLSIPDDRFNVKRFKKVTVKGLDQNGKPVTIKTKSKRVAVILQHELDHLAGITLYDKGKRL